MPLPVQGGTLTLFIRRSPFERVGLTRSQLDDWLNLTPNEFRVERELIAIGPIHAVNDLPALLDELEQLGLMYFDDFFELSGSWPDWLRLYASGEGGTPSL